MLKYAGGGICPRCHSTLVHEYDYDFDTLSRGLTEEADQRLVCRGCGYSRYVAYVVERRKKAAAR